ncbi:MAG TPA: DUF4870 domain-containing protein [Ktedonobacterales bacterium]|nr:DUF4870 domain-containing protein [Ktedonobacterales bacterium]
MTSPTDATPIPKPTLPEILLAAGAHLSSFVAPFLAPLIIWLITRKWLPFVGRHARHALVTHLLTLLAIGVLGSVAVLVFVLFLGGTISVPPTGGGLELVYFIVFVVFAVATFLAWVFGQVSCVISAIQVLRGAPVQSFWQKRRQNKPSQL